MPEAPVINLNPPRLQERRALLMAGLQEHYTPQTANTIPAQWKRLPFGKISGQLGHMAYGVVFNLDEKSGEFDYFCGVEIATISPAQQGLETYKSPQQKYAIFCHRENVSRLRDCDPGYIRHLAADFGADDGASDADFAESRRVLRREL